MLKSMPVDWNNDLFKKQRRKIWTGTNISDIACPVFAGAFSVWLEKRGYEKTVTKPMQDGLDLEPIAFEDIKSIFLSGIMIDGAFYRAVEVWQPHTLFYRDDIGANPDIMVRLTTGEIIIIELKIVQNVTNWRLYNTPESIGRIYKAYQQLNHYLYVMGLRRGIVAILNLEYLKWHFSSHKVNLGLADTNIKKAKGALKMLKSKKKADEILAEVTGKMDLAALKDNLKKVNFGMKRIEERKGLKKDVYDYPADGAEKTVYIEATEENLTLLDTLATVNHTLEAAAEKKERIESLLISRVNGNLKSGIAVDLQINRASETFDFKGLKDDGFEDNLRNSDFKEYFKFKDGAFKVVISGSKKS